MINIPGDLLKTEKKQPAKSSLYLRELFSLCVIDPIH